ncbi:hypothetical protein B9Y75_07900 [Stenotrophomonas maltophilia]|jgi:hypothetical protein|nr:hypothetical protein ARC63_17245 [Stenotrophomonas geniculata ATCC 19374 = JCM 13324]PJL71876.1 hypothetical protein B9Y75_07900 [Stenotrophomonas maltophilia]HCL43184.1 hypothetical protein [Pseudomonas sp.]
MGEVPCGGKKKERPVVEGDVPAGQGKAVEEAPCVAQAQPLRGVVAVLVQVLKLALFMVVASETRS